MRLMMKNISTQQPRITRPTALIIALLMLHCCCRLQRCRRPGSPKDGFARGGGKAKGLAFWEGAWSGGFLVWVSFGPGSGIKFWSNLLCFPKPSEDESQEPEARSFKLTKAAAERLAREQYQQARSHSPSQNQLNP